MKKYLVVIIALFAASLISYALFKNRGALPAVLPPAPIETNNSNTQATNDLGLNIPAGFSIDIFAQNLDGPRDLVIDSAGTLLASIPTKGKVVAVVDENGDGKSDKTIDILTNRDKPHGLAFFDGQLFVAEETKLTRFNWDVQKLEAKADKVLFTLPYGGRHFTRTIAFKDDGTMYVSIGSTCDVCHEKDPFQASVIVSDHDGTSPRLFAKGLRNAVFITVEEKSQKLWGVEMGRDNLGDTIPPDEINILEEDKNYGWPNCYGAQVPDKKFKASLGNSDCQNTQVPAYPLCAHCAPLGLAFINSDEFDKNSQGDLLLSLHGSWNSTKPVGYKIIKLKREGDKLVSQEDFITGFLKGNQVSGRPVDLAFSPKGELFISDDKAGVIYRLRRQ